MPRIAVRDVHKDFKLRHTHSIKETVVAAVRRRPLTTDFHALDGVTFDIKDGEAVALLGFNGSGKSTTLKMISGVLRPDNGSVLTRGRVAGLIEVGAGFHPDLSGRENIYLNAAILGMTKQETDERFDDIVAFSEIEQFIDTEVKHYSSGMFLRLAFSVAIHTEVDVLLIDEILSVGDEPFQRKCLARIRELHAAGKTLVVVSHDLNMVARLCERGIVLQHGRVVFDGPSSEAVRVLRDLSRSPFVDIERSHPAFAEILELTDARVLPVRTLGDGEAAFGPDDEVSRGAVAHALHLIAGRPTAVGGALPPDVQPGRDDAAAIGWLLAATGGSLTADFEPDRITTRGELARFLHALVGTPGGPKQSPFADVPEQDPAYTAAGWLHQAGIARGWDDARGLPTFRPDVPVTRDALVVMLSRFRDVERVPAA